MKIAILGGSFDPPHLGHLAIALQVKELVNIDEVWLMPAYHHPFNRKLSPVETRYTMTSFLETDNIRVSDYEIKHNPTSYTIDTLNGLKQQRPDDEFFWITGSDQLAQFQKYKNWKDILAKHNLIIFPREWMLDQLEAQVKEKLLLKTIPENVIVLQTKELILTNISSTKIRERVKSNLPIHYFVRNKVAAYISANKLYDK
jgi:nicotinate-nucleotide adenylyltransferase